MKIKFSLNAREKVKGMVLNICLKCFPADYGTSGITETNEEN